MTLVARATFLVLVGATFAAFFVAQRLKTEPPVIDVKRLERHFSPNGDGTRDVNRFSVALKVADDVTVDVVNLDGDRVKRLADGVRARAYSRLRLSWDGSADDGARAADGPYRLRVTLRDEGRSATVRQTMNVDTRAPRSVVCVGVPCSSRGTRNIFAPGSGPMRVYVRGVSRFNATTFRVLRTDDGRPREVARFTGAAGAHRAQWDGLVDGEPAPRGVYLIQASVRDQAGNVGTTPPRVEAGTVPGRPGLTLRGIAAQPPLRPVVAGRRAEFFVDARGRPYRWRVRRVGEAAVRKRGSERAPQLAFRAPEGPSGAYLLELRAGRWHTSVPFLVQAERRASVLVVVPAISWLGSDRVDDPPFDGIPNTLAAGGTVQWPRVLEGRDGLPAGFADGVAPLLVFLDRRRIRYDLTSDLDLDLTRNPRASDRAGVLLAGSLRWVTRPLAGRLRRYAADGGNVAVFGADSMRRGVQLRVRESEQAGTLLRATVPAAVDPFGARIGRLRSAREPAQLSQFDGDTDYGLMEGALDLSGFTQLEESVPVTGERAKLLAAVGQPLSAAEEAEAQASGKPARELRPALTAVQLGKGVVIRVGLPEWPQRLGDPDVAQVTRNIVDLLRGVAPRIRSAR